MAIEITDGKKTVVFLHIPKTGGLWLTKTLNSLESIESRSAPSTPTTNIRHATRWHLLRNYYDGYLSVIRRPESWLESAWRYYHMPGMVDLDLKVWCPINCLIPLMSQDFNHFIRNVLSAFPDGYLTWLYQLYIGPVWRQEPQRVHVDAVLKQENLSGDLLAALRAYGFRLSEQDIKKVKNSARYNVSDTTDKIVWNPKLLKKVRRVDDRIYRCFKYRHRHRTEPT